MNKIAALVLTLTAGVLMGIQPVFNAAMGRRVGVFESALLNFLVGGTALFVIVSFWGKGNFAAARTAPWYLFTGGLMGVVAVSAGILAIPRLGSAVGTVALLTGQMLTALLIDHYGFMGLERIPISPVRIVGVLLLFAGLRLITGRF